MSSSASRTIVIDTPEGIQFARVLALKAALKLEMKGMKRSAGARSAKSILNDLGFKARTSAGTLVLVEEYVKEVFEGAAQIGKDHA